MLRRTTGSSNPGRDLNSGDLRARERTTWPPPRKLRISGHVREWHPKLLRRNHALAGPSWAGGDSNLRPTEWARGSWNHAKFDFRGYATSGSVSTLTNAGFPDANARSSAGRSSPGSRTSSPCPPSDSTIWSYRVSG
jgi:hypothetical protein